MRILLVRLRLIGDVVLSTPVIRGLRRHFPDAHLTYVVEPLAAPVVRGNPHLDDVIVVPVTRGLARITGDLALGARLRRGAYDVAIDLHGGPRSAWLARASGAPRRIGYAIAGRSWMYTDVVPRSPDLTPRHSVENQWDLLAPLGIGPCSPSADSLEMADDAGARAAVLARLRGAGVTSGHHLIVMHVSAGNPFRRWSPESWSSLIVHLARHDPARRFVLSSGPSDEAAAGAIRDSARHQLGDRGDVFPELGDVDLAQLRALIGLAAAYVGGDTGPTHVASTTATPIVELLGPTLAERSRPWRDPRHFSETVDVGPLPCRPCHQRACEPGDFRCLGGIGVERVIAATERALAAAGRAPGAPAPVSDR
jgi:ADP-heptose:LPS heptosyltransferase